MIYRGEGTGRALYDRSSSSYLSVDLLIARTATPSPTLYIGDASTFDQLLSAGASSTGPSVNRFPLMMDHWTTHQMSLAPRSHRYLLA
jgi:hypothetical protein